MNWGWRQTLAVTRPAWRGLVPLLGLLVGGVVLDLLRPWPLKLMMDSVFASRPLPPTAAWLTALPGGGSATALVAWLALATVLLFAVSWTLNTLQAYLQAGFGSRLALELGAELYDHLQRLSLRFHGRHAVGDLVRRVTTDSGCLRQLIVGVVVPGLTSLATLSAMIVVMWTLDPKLAAISFLAVLPMSLVIKRYYRPMTDRAYEQQQLEGEMLALAEQTLTALAAVQAFSREQHEDSRFRHITRRTLRAYLRALASQLQFTVGINATTALGTAAIMIVGGFHVLEGSLTSGGLLVFLAYLAAFYTPLESLAQLSAGFASAVAGHRRVAEIFASDDVVRDLTKGAAIALPARSAPGGRLRFEQVTFGYDADRPVLHDINLEIAPGETVAMIGPSGAGKSTLVSLATRLFDPWQGRVTLDGIDVRDLNLSELRSHVALMLQEPFLLPLSVMDNICYGRPDATSDEAVAAAIAANADDFVRRLPHGYQTRIGQRGATLSGGEQQRLAVARTILKDASVLILDEPTSALDSQTESLLLAALERLVAGRTTLIIAHRLSTIRRADRIVVLEAGRIVEVGTHAALLAAAGGKYAGLYEAQNRQGTIVSVGCQ